MQRLLFLRESGIISFIFVPGLFACAADLGNRSVCGVCVCLYICTSMNIAGGQAALV